MNNPYVNRYRIGEYLQYMKDVLQTVRDRDAEALALKTISDDFDARVTSMEALYQITRGSEITQEIIALDARRDKAIRGIKSVASGYTNYFESAKEQAALALIKAIEGYGENIARRSYQEESIILTNLIKDIETKAELSAAITTLDLSDWITELKTTNTQFITKYLARVKETAANPNTNINELRAAVTEGYLALLERVKAHAVLSDNSAYSTILNEVEVLAKQYNQVVDNRITNAQQDPEEEIPEDTTPSDED